MKKFFSVLVLGAVIASCNNNNTQPKDEFKTAYIDTSKLMEKSTEAQDIEAKFKNIADEKDNKLKSEAQKLETEMKNFQSNAQKNGQAWAQQKYGELQQRDQQLRYAQQAILSQLQQESGQEMDSLVVRYKKVIKDYGKEKGYDYVFGTGEPASILYAKDSYDITKEIIEKVNSAYKKEDKTETKKDKPAKEEAKK